MKPYLFHHHTREQLKTLAAQGCAAVVPLAATEQHGPHLTVYTDSLICEHVVYRAVERALSNGSEGENVKLLAAPVLAVGCSEHHKAFGGTLSLTPQTYLRVLTDIGDSLVASGFRKIIFLNAHGGNASAMSMAANDLAVRYPIWTACASYWSIAMPALQQANATEVGRVPGHAGGFETSLVLALDESLVDVRPIMDAHLQRPWIASGRPGSFVGKHRELTGVNGYTDPANRADAALGRQYLDLIVNEVARWLDDTFMAMTEGGDPA